MNLNVGKEVAALERLTVGELRERYAKLFAETTQARNRLWLLRRIVWRMQSLAEGGLSEQARQRAEELANTADLRVTAPRESKLAESAAEQTKTVSCRIDGGSRLPLPGTVLSRSLLDFARMMEVFEKHHVSFVSVTQQFNTATSMGRLVLNVLLSFAQFEREMISERVRDKVAAARRKGKWSGGMPLLGYTAKETKLIVDEVEAQRVRQIFELYLEYQSLLPTVTELNRRGWTTKRWTTKKGGQRGGRLFTKNCLYALLTNVTYIGQIKYKEEVHRGEHEALVPEELFRRVQSLLQRNGHTGGRAVRNKYGALLRGLLRCGPCGCAMSHTYTAKGNRRYHYYVCGTAQQRGWSQCACPSVPAGEIERFVVEQIKCIGRDPAILADTLRQVRQQTETGTEQLSHERTALQQQLRDDYARLQATAAMTNQFDRVSGLADLQEHIRTAERRLTEVDNELISLREQTIDESEVATTLAEFDQLWEALAPREQARVLELLVARVDYDGQRGKVSVTFQPTGIQSLTQELAHHQEHVA